MIAMVLNLQLLEKPKLISRFDKSKDPQIREYHHTNSKIEVIFQEPNTHRKYEIWKCELRERGEIITEQHNFKEQFALEYISFIIPWKGFQPWSNTGEKFCFIVDDYGTIIYNFSTLEIIKIEVFGVNAILCAPSAPFILFCGSTSFITDLDGKFIAQILPFDGFNIKGIGWTEDSKYIIAAGHTKTGEKPGCILLMGPRAPL
ncbi:MAG: hypothetical protein ACTSVZ_09305 [Promethearchaeota archaeon]